MFCPLQCPVGNPFSNFYQINQSSGIGCSIDCLTISGQKIPLLMYLDRHRKRGLKLHDVMRWGRVFPCRIGMIEGITTMIERAPAIAISELLM
jgi:hypothetical protein